MRAVGHAAALEFLFAGHFKLLPSGAGGGDDGLGAEFGAVFEHEPPHVALAFDLCDGVRGDDVDVVGLQMRREVAGERGAVRLEDGREVLDVGGFVHLAAEAVGNDARTQALAGGVDGGRAARRAAADNE